MHWSRYLLAYMQVVTGAQLLVGVRAMAYKQHYQFYVSLPANAIDRHSGALLTWPQVQAILLLDSFMRSVRST